VRAARGCSIKFLQANRRYTDIGGSCSFEKMAKEG